MHARRYLEPHNPISNGNQGALWVPARVQHTDVGYLVVGSSTAQPSASRWSGGRVRLFMFVRARAPFGVIVGVAGEGERLCASARVGGACPISPTAEKLW